jgi:hypothetical protein
MDGVEVKGHTFVRGGRVSRERRRCKTVTEDVRTLEATTRGVEAI